MDKQTFDETFLPLYGRMHHLVYRKVGERELTQEAYLQAFGERGDCTEQPAAWICRIGMHLALAWLRRRKRWWSKLPRLWSQSASTFDGQCVDENVGRSLMLKLPERERSILLLRAVGELSYEEIAGIVGVPANLVGVHLQRARAKALAAAREMGLEK